MRAHDLAAALGVSHESVRRWLRRLGLYRPVGSGHGLVLTAAEVQAVTVAFAVGGSEAKGGPASVASTSRTVRAAHCTLTHPWASYILATPEWATPHESPESTIATWHAKGTPVAAIVSVADVMGRLREQAA